MGRARKQKHGKAEIDGKGRYARGADDSMIPRQAKTAEIRHREISDRTRRIFKRH